MYQLRRILKMDLFNLFTNPMWWFYSIGFPLLIALILGFLTSSDYGREVSAYSYYGITMMVFGALNTATVAANSFMEGRILKANMRLCTAPVPAFHIYFTKIVAAAVFSICCHTLTGLLLHLLVKVNFGGSHVWWLWLLLVAIDFFAASFSIMMCCLLKNEEVVNQLLSNLITVICLLGGAFFPLKGFGKIIDVITNISLATWIHAAAFQAIYDNNLLLLRYVGLVLVIGALLSIGVSIKYFNREDYL